jgi:NAD(P)-dependent dehydrogenase (short-subunit alcohol dehydrogenase family)
MTSWLDGKRALVVGAGSGIGRAVVDAFRDEGAKVAVLERDPGKCTALRAQLPDVPVVEGDATAYEANERAVAAAVDAFGGLDTLVNCVGIFDFYNGIGDISPDDLPSAFDEMFRTNVLSHVQSVKAALGALRQAGGSGGSSIVLTESASSFYPGRGGVLYVSSKFAVRGLVSALAHELAPQIRVNGVAPGGTLGTDLRGLASLGLGDTRLDDRGDRARDVAARTPLHVALSGEDHASSYVFLASDRSRGITGETVRPDGGFGLGARESAPKPAQP